MVPAADPIDPTKITPGAGALVVFIFFIVVAIVMFRSLKKQLNRVDFQEPAESSEDQKKV